MASAGDFQGGDESFPGDGKLIEEQKDEENPGAVIDEEKKGEKKKKRKKVSKTDGEKTDELEGEPEAKEEKKKRKKKKEAIADGEKADPDTELEGKDENKKKKKKAKKDVAEAKTDVDVEVDDESKKKHKKKKREKAKEDGEATDPDIQVTETADNLIIEGENDQEGTLEDKSKKRKKVKRKKQSGIEETKEEIEKEQTAPEIEAASVETTNVESFQPFDEDQKGVSGDSTTVEVFQSPEIVNEAESSGVDIVPETIKQDDDQTREMETVGSDANTKVEERAADSSLIDDQTSEKSGAKLEVKKEKKKRSKSKENGDEEKSKKKKKDKSEVKDGKKPKKSKKHKEKGGETTDESPREALETSQENGVESVKADEQTISEQQMEPETTVQMENKTDVGDGSENKIGAVEVFDTEAKPMEVDASADGEKVTEVVPFDGNIENGESSGEPVEAPVEASVEESPVEAPVEGSIEAPVEESPVETQAEDMEKTDEIEKNEEETTVTPIIELGDLMSRQDEEEPKLEFSWSEARRQRTPAEAQWQTWEAEEVEDNMEFDPEAEVGRLKGLVQEMEKMEVGDYYLSQFEDAARQDALMVGAIDIQEIQLEEQKLREQHLQFEEQEKAKMASALEELREREKMAKERLAKQVRDRRQQFSNDDTLFEQRQRYALDQLMKSFKRAEKQLVERLTARRGEVQALYGDLQTVSGKYDGSEGRRWKVDWDLTPQPIQINLKTLRGVKNKLPAGHYVLMVSLYSRLGGMPLRWSRHKDQLWGGSTVPISHSGHFYNVEMKVDQSVFTALPPRPDIKPGMVLVFELFLLRGSVVPVDVVVGWGCFPICDGKFRYIEGKYKTPMLRGPMDPGIDSHEALEYSVALDLDNWLCNMYFELKCLPRYLAGQKEYEVELQFSSQLLGFPDRVEVAPAEGEMKNANSPIFDEITQQTLEEATESLEQDTGSIQFSTKDESREDAGEETGENVKKPIKSATNSRKNSTLPGSSLPQPGSDSSPTTSTAQLQNDQLEKKRSLSSNPDLSGSTVVKIPDDSLLSKEDEKKNLAFLGSRALRAWQMRQRKVAEDDPDFPWHVMYNLGEQEEHDYAPLLGEPGVYYKYHRCTAREDYQSHLNTLLPRTPGLRQTTRKLKGQRSVLSDLELHTYAVDNGFNASGHRLHHSSRHRMAYINRMLMSELGLSQWRASKFWITLFLLALCFFITMYVHYCGQWIFLTALGIPVNRFDFYPYTVALNYQASLLTPGELAALVLMGPLWVLIIFLLLMLLSLVCILTLHRFPELCSQFILTYGVMTLLDPELIMIVDLILGRQNNVGGGKPIADCAKLYYLYLRTDGTGLAGVLVTVLIYFLISLLTLLALYVFFIRLYNMGRILDVYWRLHGSEEKFLVPMDLEVSGLELAHLVKRAEMWRGEEGERRKISVTDYIWEEELAEDDDEEERQKKEEVTTHVAIHTIHLDGLQEIYRHFLRLPEGAIIEVFGDSVGLSTMHENLTLALQQDAKEIEARQLPKMEMSVIEQQMLLGDGDGTKQKKDGENGRPSILLPWNAGDQDNEKDDPEPSGSQEASPDGEAKIGEAAGEVMNGDDSEIQTSAGVEETIVEQPEEKMVAVDEAQTNAAPTMDEPAPELDKPQGEEETEADKPQTETIQETEKPPEEAIPVTEEPETVKVDEPHDVLVDVAQEDMAEASVAPITSQPINTDRVPSGSEEMRTAIEGEATPAGDAGADAAENEEKSEKKKKKKKRAKKSEAEDGGEIEGEATPAGDAAEDDTEKEEKGEKKKKKKKKGKKSDVEDSEQIAEAGTSDGEELIKKSKKKKKKGKDKKE